MKLNKTNFVEPIRNKDENKQLDTNKTNNKDLVIKDTILNEEIKPYVENFLKKDNEIYIETDIKKSNESNLDKETRKDKIKTFQNTDFKNTTEIDVKVPKIIENKIKSKKNWVYNIHLKSKKKWSLPSELEKKIKDAALGQEKTEYIKEFILKNCLNVYDVSCFNINQKTF